MDVDVSRMAEQALHLIFSVDAQRRVTYVNGAVRHVLGYEPDEVVGTSFLEYVDPDERDEAEEAWSELAGGEPLRRADVGLRSRAGRYVPLVMDALPRLDAEGRFAGVDGIGCPMRAEGLPHDMLLEQMAGLRRVGETLTSSGDPARVLEDLVRYPIHLGADACWIGLLEEGTLDVRPVAHAGPDGSLLAAIEAGRAGGRSPIERAIIAREAVVEALEDADASVPLVAEARRLGYRSLAVVPLVCADQPLGIACVYSREPAFFDDWKLHLLGLFAQIAASAVVSARALEHARQTEMRFRELVEHLPCVVHVAEPTFPPKYLFVSSNVEPWLGYSPEDFYADGTTAFKAVHPDDRDRVSAEVSRKFALPGSYTLDFRVVHRSGKDVYHVRLCSLPLLDSAGKLVLRHGIVVDVTEEKRLEQELLQSQRLAAIGEMAAMMAHEIRNPLAGMSLALRALRGSTDSPRPEPVEGRGAKGGEIERECLDDLAHCLGRINATVSRVLDFSKARRVVPRRCALGEVIEAAQRLTATYVRRSEVTVHTDIQPDLPDLVADPDQLEQVFVNLILNACRAMPDGGRVAIRVRADAQHICAEVADPGIGIAPDELSHIFDPFYSGFRRGTGLGLTICQRIVQAHGGRIHVRSSPGQGSTFRVELPLDYKPGTTSKEERGSSDTSILPDAGT